MIFNSSSGKQTLKKKAPEQNASQKLTEIRRQSRQEYIEQVMQSKRFQMNAIQIIQKEQNQSQKHQNEDFNSQQKVEKIVMKMLGQNDVDLVYKVVMNIDYEWLYLLQKNSYQILQLLSSNLMVPQGIMSLGYLIDLSEEFAKMAIIMSSMEEKQFAILEIIIDCFYKFKIAEKQQDLYLWVLCQFTKRPQIIVYHHSLKRLFKLAEHIYYEMSSTTHNEMSLTIHNNNNQPQKNLHQGKQKNQIYVLLSHLSFIYNLKNKDLQFTVEMICHLCDNFKYLSSQCNMLNVYVTITNIIQQIAQSLTTKPNHQNYIINFNVRLAISVIEVVCKHAEDRIQHRHLRDIQKKDQVLNDIFMIYNFTFPEYFGTVDFQHKKITLHQYLASRQEKVFHNYTKNIKYIKFLWNYFKNCQSDTFSNYFVENELAKSKNNCDKAMKKSVEYNYFDNHPIFQNLIETLEIQPVANELTVLVLKMLYQMLQIQENGSILLQILIELNLKEKLQKMLMVVETEMISELVEQILGRLTFI